LLRRNSGDAELEHYSGYRFFIYQEPLATPSDAEMEYTKSVTIVLFDASKQNFALSFDR
jgi:hypothetical protein